MKVRINNKIVLITKKRKMEEGGGNKYTHKYSQLVDLSNEIREAT